MSYRPPARRRGSRGPWFVAFTVLAACSSGGGVPSGTSTTSTDPSTSAAPLVDDKVLVLGAVLPRGGAAPEMGVSLRAAIDLAVQQINDSGGVLGAPVRVVTSDEGDTPSSALLAVQGLIENGVDAIIGPTSSLNLLSTLSTSAQAGVLTCSPTASALSLDDFPDRGLFFRTVPSDSLEAQAIALAVEESGSKSVALVYLDDAYGRPFGKATERAIQRNTTVSPSVGFSATEQSIASAVTAVTAADPTVVVVIGSNSSGPAIIRAIDSASTGTRPTFVVNDAVRRPDASAPPFGKDLGARVRGVSPPAYSTSVAFTEALHSTNPDATGLYAANAYDCVNLIALAAQSSGSTLGTMMALTIPSVSTGGSTCASFPDCNEVLSDGRNPDYSGPDGSTSVDRNGNVTSARYERFSFDEGGRDIGRGHLTVGG